MCSGYLCLWHTFCTIWESLSMLSWSRELNVKLLCHFNFYQSLHRYVAIYVEILVRIIVRDVLQFLIVFIVIAVSFGGGLYFSLRAKPCTLPQNTTGSGFSPATNTSLCLHPDETRYTMHGQHNVCWNTILSILTVKYTFHGWLDFVCLLKEMSLNHTFLVI